MLLFGLRVNIKIYCISLVFMCDVTSCKSYSAWKRIWVILLYIYTVFTFFIGNHKCPGCLLAGISPHRRLSRSSFLVWIIIAGQSRLFIIFAQCPVHHFVTDNSVTVTQLWLFSEYYFSEVEDFNWQIDKQLRKKERRPFNCWLLLIHLHIWSLELRQWHEYSIWLSLYNSNIS